MKRPSNIAPLLLLAALAVTGEGIGQTPLRLSSNSGPGARYPVVALDADAIAYLGRVGGSRELFVGATDGSPPTRLTNGANIRVGHGTFDAWSPISISDDGQVLAYWNAQGVHVLDRGNNTDTVVATTNLLPMPRLAGDGSRLVYQAPMNGQLEVFLVDSAGASPAVQLTSTSGAGRRLPFLRGDRVLFQKLVANEMELYLHDLATNTTGPALTSGSGGGNRHGRLSPDGTAVAYEAVVGSVQTAMRLDLLTQTATAIAPGTSGSRLPQADQDEQIVLQSNVIGPEVVLADPALANFTSGSRGGHRLPSLDRHGQLIAWQREYQGDLEVFALRRCWPATVSNYGSAGQPSVGALQSFDAMWRCEVRFGVDTQLPSGTPALYLVGLQPQNLPVPLAPGNFQLVVELGVSLLLADARGDVTATVPLSSDLLGFTYRAQFGLLDPAANPLGLVTSEGFALQIL